MTKKVLIAVLKKRVSMKIASLSTKVPLNPEGYDSGYNDGYYDGLCELLAILEDYD